MDSEKPCIDNAESCLKLLQEYLPNDFPTTLTTEDINYSTQTGGLVNTLKLITRNSDNYKVLIREYGGNVFDVDLTKHIKTPIAWQLLIFYELSKRGIGPRLLGVFEGGRIEEFIPSHTLKPTEYDDYDLMKDLAINTAMIHNVKLPFNQSPTSLTERMMKWRQELASKFNPVEFMSKYKDAIINCGADFNKYVAIMRHDWKGEGERSKAITDKFKPRTGLTLWDNNSLNVLIRDNVSDGQLKTCIIDFECCRYDSVIRDIAARFVNRLVNFGGKGREKVTGFDIPNEDVRKHFLREYLKEDKKQKQSTNLTVTEDEVNEWLYEVDHFIPQTMTGYVVMTFMADMFLGKDISYVFMALSCYEKYLEWKSYLKTKYGTEL